MATVADMTAAMRGFVAATDEDVCAQAEIEGAELGRITPRFFATAVVPLLTLCERSVARAHDALLSLSRLRAERAACPASEAPACADDTLSIVFSMLDTRSFLAAQRVCRQWRVLRLTPRAWPYGRMDAYMLMLRDPARQKNALSVLHAVALSRNAHEVARRAGQLVELLSSPSDDIQAMVARILSNAASHCQTDNARDIVDAGVLEPVTKMLASGLPRGVACAVEILRNVCGDQDAPTEAFSSIVPAVLRALADLRAIADLRVLDPRATVEILQDGCAFLDSIHRRGALLRFASKALVLATFEALLFTDDEHVLDTSCYVLSGVYRENGELATTQVCARLAELASHDKDSVSDRALLAFAHAVSAKWVAAQAEHVALVGAGLSRTSEFARRHACWALANLAATNSAFANAIAEAHLVAPLMRLARSDTEGVRIYAASALAAFFMPTNRDSGWQGVLSAMSACISLPDDFMRWSILKAWKRALGPNGEPAAAHEIRLADGFAWARELTRSGDAGIAELARGVVAHCDA